jgi:hypothetical protein
MFFLIQEDCPTSSQEECRWGSGKPLCSGAALGVVLLICLFCVDGVVVGWARRAARQLFRWRRGMERALGEVERLYREGRVEEALGLADRLAERDPGATWDYFIIKAAEAKDLEERSFWVVAASKAARQFMPSKFLPVRR